MEAGVTNMNATWRWTLSGGVVLLGSGLAWMAVASEDEPAREAGPFDEMILEAAQEYEGWERVSDTLHWSPYLCAAPMRRGAQVSQSDDESTHGRKLYYLYAKKPELYGSQLQVTLVPREPSDNIGQVLVKQSWHPVEVDPNSVEPWRPPENWEPEGFDQGYLWSPEYAFTNEKAYKTGEQGPLFMMLKLDPGTSGTDEGWVYATLTPDGSEITAAGRIASCMGCHVTAKHDRLLGVGFAALE